MKRWPIIRHIRFFYLRWRFNVWWAAYGQYLGAAPNESDLEHLQKVWEGRE